MLMFASFARDPGRRSGVAALVGTPLLLALAQTPFQLAPLALVALVPWLAATQRASAIGAATLGAAVGTLYAAAGAPWISEALRAFGASAPSAALGLLLTAAWTKGVPFALAGVAAHAMRRRSVGASALAIAALFSATETLQSRFALGLPLGLLGHTQGSVPGVAQLAVVGGVPLVSALLAGVNQAIARAITRPLGWAPWRVAAGLLAAWVSLALLGLPLARALRNGAADSSDPLELLIVQPNIPRGHRWAPDLQALHLERVAAYTEEALRGERERGVVPDAVLWPENLITAPLDGEIGAVLHAATDRLGVTVITGLVRSTAGGDPLTYRSSVLWLAPGGEIVAERDKMRAVPLIESARRGWGAAWLVSALGVGDGLRVEEARGTGPLRGAFSAAPLLCYEALFPALTASRRDAETRVILNLADDSWVPGDTATRQLSAAVRFRAIEQRLPLVRVAHGGLSAAFDPFGESILELPRYSYAHAVVEIPPSAPPTLLERVSLFALPLTAFGVVWCAWPVQLRRRSSIRNERSGSQQMQLLARHHFDVTVRKRALDRHAEVFDHLACGRQGLAARIVSDRDPDLTPILAYCSRD